MDFERTVLETRSSQFFSQRPQIHVSTPHDCETLRVLPFLEFFSIGGNRLALWVSGLVGSWILQLAELAEVYIDDPLSAPTVLQAKHFFKELGQRLPLQLKAKEGDGLRLGRFSNSTFRCSFS